MLLVPLFVLSSQIGYSQNNELLDSLIKIEKPYLIVNLVSSDCINCKSNAVGLLHKICPEKVVLLYDDPMMKSFLKKNASLPKGITYLYSKKISQDLAVDHFSSVNLVEKGNIRKFDLNTDLDKNATYLENIIVPHCDTQQLTSLADSCKLLGKIDLKDTVINPAHSGFAYSRNQYLFFNYKFQVGQIVHEQHLSIEYLELDVPDSFQRRLHKVIQKSIPAVRLLEIGDTLPFENNTNKMLKIAGQPKVQMASYNGTGLFFYLNYCFWNKPIEDTSKVLRIAKNTFVAYGKMTGSAFDIHNYKNITMVDSLHYNGLILVPRSRYGFQVCKDKMYVVYASTDAVGLTTSSSRYSICRLNPMNDGKAILEEAYRIDVPLDSIPDLIFRISDSGDPVVLNKKNKKWMLLKDSIEISADSLTLSGKCRYVYDYRVVDSKLQYVVLQEDNQIIYGEYDLFTQKNKSKFLTSGIVFSDFQLVENDIVGYYKNEETNELMLRHFVK